MYRFYYPALPCEDIFTIHDDQAHHARHVLRLRPGDRMELFDGEGAVATAVLESWNDAGRRPRRQAVATARLLARHVVARPKPWIDVAAAVPKGPRLAAMVSALTQVGADRLILMRSERSVTDPRSVQLERLRRVAIESARQCGRAYLLSIEATIESWSALNDVYDLRWIASLDEDSPSDQRPVPSNPSRVLLLIGPEGGWTDEEMETAVESGCAPWRLGPHIMRIETAATVAVAVLRYLAAS